MRVGRLEKSYNRNPGCSSNSFRYSELKRAMYSEAVGAETYRVFSLSAGSVTYPLATRNARYTCPVFDASRPQQYRTTRRRLSHVRQKQC